MAGPGTTAWSADGNFGVTADGYPGWTADGYEPTPESFAVTFLAGLGVNVGTITYAYSVNGTPLGWVITAYPHYGALVPAGGSLNLVVSNGPAPPATLAVVPNVVGMYYIDAQLAILAAGMLIAPPKWVLNPALPGYVVGQSLAAGTQQNPQTQLAITVSGFQVVNQPGVIVPVP